MESLAVGVTETDNGIMVPSGLNGVGTPLGSHGNGQHNGIEAADKTVTITIVLR